MTPEPGRIKAVRLTQWKTSDGAVHRTPHEAREHEKRLALLRTVGAALQSNAEGRDAVRLVVEALLAEPTLLIVLAPAKGGGE